MSAPVGDAGAASRTFLLENRDAIAAKTVDLHWARRPELETRYGATGRGKCLEDAVFHLGYLADAVGAGTASLFVDYLAWGKVLLGSLNIPAEDLAENLDCLCQALEELAGPELAGPARVVLKEGTASLPGLPAESPTYLLASNPQVRVARRYLDALMKGKRAEASLLVTQAADDGVAIRDIYLEVFQPVQYEIGRLWQVNQLSVAQEHFCTAATQLIMSQLYPRLFGGQRLGRTMVSTCVAGNLHELGARMVADFFEMEGWDAYYVGANTPTSSLLSTVAEQSADLVAISATLTSQVGQVAEVVAALRAGLEQPPPILVGGYPFKLAGDLWKQVGADGTAASALDAVSVADRLLQERSA